MITYPYSFVIEHDAFDDALNRGAEIAFNLLYFFHLMSFKRIQYFSTSLTSKFISRRFEGIFELVPVMLMMYGTLTYFASKNTVFFDGAIR